MEIEWEEREKRENKEKPNIPIKLSLNIKM